ncbi:MAG: phytanoyl-CoA dioxygenase family protein [Candidatus Latescibacterota bacterium]|nr:phytanoyl-CoA dioxygenase family protein [Candidatus Latescibacterota bacterium]
MTPEGARQKREQLIRNGYCVIDEVLSEEFLQELRDESDRLMADWVRPDEFKYQGEHVVVNGETNQVIQRLLDWAPARQALTQMQMADFASHGSIIILTKDPGEPALYWHQDWMQWNDPMSVSPWPQVIFLSYYLSDTSVENGCLKVIPHTHHKRIPLHDELVPAHEQGASFIEEDHPVMFSDYPDQVNVCVKAGSLVLADARVLHSAHRNLTDERRTLILAWHRRPNTVPDYWEGEIPEVIANRDPDAEFEGSRIPREFLH